jgi:hypothetical protein
MCTLAIDQALDLEQRVKPAHDLVCDRRERDLISFCRDRANAARVRPMKSPAPMAGRQ